MKILVSIILLMMTLNLYSAENFYNLKAAKINGDSLNFSDLKGKKLLIVNVASYCGYTYQYSELQSLYSQYGGDKFEIVAFPANNFSNQEPGSDSSIYEFCTDTYKVTFTMMSKISVKGADKHPVYQWLTLKSKNGVVDQEVLWNFQKYLVNEAGQIVGIYGSKVSPLAKEIVDWVKEENTSIIENKNNYSIKLSPNPATDFIEISIIEQANSQNSDIKIFNAYGECVKNLASSQFQNGEEARIDISQLPVGMYIIQIGSYTKKFAVIR